MAKTISLKAQARQAQGRNAVKSIRRSGLIPGIVYGKKGTQSIEINGKELSEALRMAHSENVLVDLKLTISGAEQTKLAFLQDVQHDYLADCILHVDLHEVAADEKLHVEVPIAEVGEAEGVKTGGGLLETPLRRLRIECLPKDLPEEIVIDVSHLKIGDSIHVRDIKLPAGVVALNAKDQTVVTVAAPLVEEVASATATDVKQPEVIKEKKKDEAAGDAKGKGDAKAKTDAKAKPDAKKK